MIRQISILWILLLACSVAKTQTALLNIDMEGVGEGLTLIYPHNQSNLYLLNNCGQIVHVWEDEDQYRPGNTAYLLENGDVIKTKRFYDLTIDSIWAGGAGAIVERRTWDNELLWRFELNNERFRLHHDIEVLPNGNVLMISWESIDGDQAIELGRKPDLLIFDELWAEKVIEYDPTTDSIVWEWRVFDHVVQNFDSSKMNFGVPYDHPDKIDINLDVTNGRPDWLHANSIDYHPDRDEILLGVPFLSEIWIIDHSDSNGGLKYRWGNPTNYCDSSRSQILFNPHDAHWNLDFLESSDERYGKIAVFNNRYSRRSSAAHLFDPYDENNDYLLDGACYGPSDVSQTYFYPSKDSIVSATLSSIQSLSNGNTLMVYGKYGLIVELDEDDRIVWEYKLPLLKGSPVSRRADLIVDDNLLFNAFKYPITYAAFEDRVLEPLGYIEVEQDFVCGGDMITSTDDVSITQRFSAYPNPVSDFVKFEVSLKEGDDVQLYNWNGLPVKNITVEYKSNLVVVEVAGLPSGLYVARLGTSSIKFFKL